MSDDWKKVVARKACDIIDADNLSAASRTLLNREDSPRALVHKLVKAEQWPDAITVMAHCLPRREAVWWACVCSRKAGAEDDVKALEAAEQWVFKPSGERRAEAFREAQESASASAGALVALAVASSESKLAIDKEVEIELDAAAFPQIVVAAVLVAEAEAAKKESSPFSLFVAMGENIAQGGNGRVDSPINPQ